MWDVKDVLRRRMDAGVEVRLVADMNVVRVLKKRDAVRRTARLLIRLSKNPDVAL